jgi:hypothetical protein
MFKGGFVVAMAACAVGRAKISSIIPTSIDIFSGGKGEVAIKTRSMSVQRSGRNSLRTAVVAKAPAKDLKASSGIRPRRSPPSPTCLRIAGRAVGHAAFEADRYVDANARPDVAKNDDGPVTGAHLLVMPMMTSGKAKLIKACPSFGVRQGRGDCARA